VAILFIFCEGERLVHITHSGVNFFTSCDQWFTKDNYIAIENCFKNVNAL